MDVYISVLLLLTGLITCYGQRCDDSLLRKCREDVGRQSERRSIGLSQTECRNFRENLDCLLDQTVLCKHRESEREEYGAEITQAHGVLQRVCDREEGWDRNRCFQRDEIRRCEENFPRRIYDADTETCRKYEELKECIGRIIDNYCGQSDRAYLKSYYLDIARGLPWKCTTTSSIGYPSHRPDDNFDSTRRNRTYGSDKTCCKSEHCEDRDRLRNCRQELIQIVEGRSNILPYGNSQARCKIMLNTFNCFLWHTYNCQQTREKDTYNIENAKRYIQDKCDINGDLRMSKCYEEPQMKDCDRHLQEESSSQSDVTCREYEFFFDCVERQMRQIRTCSYEDELLQGFYLINKADSKAWTCSKKESTHTGYTPYDNRNTYPYGDPYSTSMTGDDHTCEIRARRELQKCLNEKEKIDDEARRTQDKRERQVKSCCAAFQFRECIRQIVRQNCERERSNVVDSLMGNTKDRIYQCQDVNQSTCSASRMLNNAIIIVMAVAILRSMFQQ